MDHHWTATWIASPEPLNGSGPMPLFRTSFSLQRTPAVKQATLRICGLGQFEARVNGNKVGEDMLEPGWTQYRKTCLFLKRDVTSLILPGENVIGVVLGNGMYHVAGGRYRKFKGSFGPPKVISELSLELIDGTLHQVTTDATWKTAEGPIRFSCIYGGEDHDARREPAGWDTRGFDDGTWNAAVACEGPGGKLVEQRYSPVRVMKVFPAKEIGTTAPGVRVFDLGQNISGVPGLKMHGAAGQSVTLKTGERLDSQGRVSQKNTGGPVTFQYTTRGEAAEFWSPRFSLTGFRYVEATGDLQALQSVHGLFIHNSAREVGSFECSDELLNQIHRLILAAIRSNFHSVFTDCPHREKLGWLEQAHLMAPSILSNFDARSLFTKVSQDMRDAQHDSGMVPTIAPQYTQFNPPWDVFNDSPEWGAACVLAPLFVHRFTGDLDIVRDNYDVMARFVSYLETRKDERGIVTYGLGDWYDIGPGDPGFGKLTTLGLTATASLIQCLDALYRFSQMLDRPVEATLFQQRSEKARAAFNRVFYNPDQGTYDRGSQCANGMALALGICEPRHRETVLESLVADIRANGNHITAGDIGFRYVLNALADAGRNDVVYDLISQLTPPSYAAQLQQGATTLTEAWDANPDKSLNHMMLGHAEEWFYRHLVGIQINLAALANEPHLLIAPAPVGNVAWGSAHYEMSTGRVECAWSRRDGNFELEVNIPSQIRASVQLPSPGAPARSLTAGRHRLSCRL